MSRAQVIFGPILNPRADGKVDFIPRGAIACDDAGIITFVGDAGDAWLSGAAPAATQRRMSHGMICPPFLDAHIHIPQHPIRGRFMEGVAGHPPEGRLLAGLNRNVFPAEAKCADISIAAQIVRDFARDTLAKGVVGGAAYMTVHETATDIALSNLHELWSVGLVLMEMNCPLNLRNDDRVDESMRRAAESYGRRFIVTDRFAVAVGSDLRRRGVAIAAESGLRTQTHLNEQVSEKQFVERQLYPRAQSYTDVYATDGLLDHDAILAHCIHNRPDELDLIASKKAVVAHCPTSNTLLTSGIMPLDELVSRGIEYAICTDVGASPTTSMLAEMAQYLKVHAGRSRRATPGESLYRSTLAPAKILALEHLLGTFAVGRPMSLVEIDFGQARNFRDADDAILRGLLGMTEADLARYSSPGELHDALDGLATGRLDVGAALDSLDRDVRKTAARLEHRVISTTLQGEQVFASERPSGGIIFPTPDA
jgi:guanine deaminase